MKLTDFRGNHVKIGSIIVYPTRQSSHMWMVEGEVVSVEETIDWVGRSRPKVGVRRTRKDDGTVVQNGRITFPAPERLVVVS